MTFMVFTLSCIIGCIPATPAQPIGIDSEQEVECDRTVSVGTQRICLPTILGMRECSGMNIIMTLPGVQVSDKSTILGLYVQTRQLENLENELAVGLDDYFKVYTMNSLSNKEISDDDLITTMDGIERTMQKRKWTDIGSNLEELFNGVQFGQPVSMERYRPSNHVVTMVYLSPIQGASAINRYNLMSMSLCCVKSRLVFVVHYLKYDGIESVRSAKAKSDYFTLRLVEENM